MPSPRVFLSEMEVLAGFAVALLALLPLDLRALTLSEVVELFVTPALVPLLVGALEARVLFLGVLLVPDLREP